MRAYFLGQQGASYTLLLIRKQIRLSIPASALLFPPKFLHSGEVCRMLCLLLPALQGYGRHLSIESNALPELAEKETASFDTRRPPFSFPSRPCLVHCPFLF